MSEKARKILHYRQITEMTLTTNKAIAQTYSRNYLVPQRVSCPPSRGGHEILQVMPHSMLPDFINGLNVLADLRTDVAKRIRIANRLSKPSRGTSAARDEQQSTETLSFRCCCERCCLTRGVVLQRSFRRNSVSVESE